MCTLDSFLSRMGFTVAITVFSMATLAFIGCATAKERLKQNSTPQFNRLAFRVLAQPQ